MAVVLWKPSENFIDELLAKAESSQMYMNSKKPNSSTNGVTENVMELEENHGPFQFDASTEPIVTFPSEDESSGSNSPKNRRRR